MRTALRPALALSIGWAWLLGGGGGAAEAPAGFAPAQYVNVFHPGGNVFRGANVPFGMVMAGPAGSGTAGRSATQDVFVLTRFSGAWEGMNKDAYDVAFVPFTADTPPAWGEAMRFKTAAQEASPGYCRVQREDGVTIELTATARTCMARITYPRGVRGRFLIGPSFLGQTNIVQVVGNDAMSGTRDTVSTKRTRANSHFHAQFDKPFKSFGVRTPEGDRPGQGAGEGTDAYAYAVFGEDVSTVLVKIGLSFVSRENAKGNLEQENPGWDFEAVRRSAADRWNDALGRIRIEGGSEDDRRLFYTCLYRCLFHMNVYSDANGEYTGFDRKTHVAEGFTFYANVSGWDIYRCWVQLVAALFPQETSDMMRSCVLSAEQRGGELPVWTAFNRETMVMGGDPCNAIIAGAHAFGATGFDARAALLAMEPAGRGKKAGESRLRTGGWGSDLLEKLAGDFAIAKMALAVGDRDKHAFYLKAAQRWKEMFNPETGWLDGKREGSRSNWQEGSAEVYTWMVLHNLGGLIERMGGREKAAAKLDGLFEKRDGIGYMAMGNEPGFGMAWVFTWAGQPWKSQEKLRQVLERKRKDLGGDDDLGSMSAWCVWNMLGLYPAIPGEGGLVMSGPLFPSATVRWGADNVLTIAAPNADVDAPYCQSVSLNGKPHPRMWLTLDELAGKETRLEFAMGREPNRAWGTDPEDAPPSFDAGE